MVKYVDETWTELTERGDALRAENVAQNIEMGNLSPETVPIAGVASLTAAKDNQLRVERDKREKSGDFIMQLSRVEAYLRAMDRRIAELETRIAQLIEQRQVLLDAAQETYERGFEADDLIEAIKDGILAEERERLIALLGPEAAGLTAKELTQRLEAEKIAAHEAGDSLTSQSEAMSERINSDRKLQESLIALRDDYQTANPARHLQIEAEFGELTDQPTKEQRVEQAVEVTPDFTVRLP